MPCCTNSHMHRRIYSQNKTYAGQCFNLPSTTMYLSLHTDINIHNSLFQILFLGNDALMYTIFLMHNLVIFFFPGKKSKISVCVCVSRILYPQSIHACIHETLAATKIKEKGTGDHSMVGWSFVWQGLEKHMSAILKFIMTQDRIPQ